MIARRTPSRQIRFNATNESLWISYQIGFPLCVDSTKRKLRPDFGARCSKLSKSVGRRRDRVLRPLPLSTARWARVPLCVRPDRAWRRV